jgi:hypothetical protein
MSFQRLVDVKTPPFAYVVNRSEVLKQCPQCLMPYRELAGPLQVEILTTDLANWQKLIPGQPLMAEDWLIGDAKFLERFCRLVPHCESRTVQVVSWLARKGAMIHPDLKPLQTLREVPPFFLIQPSHAVEMTGTWLEDYPAMACPACERSVADIPFEFQVTAASGAPHAFAYLKDLPLEGYDYLFETSLAEALANEFPRLVFESMAEQPQLF